MNYSIAVGRWLLHVRPAPLASLLKRLLCIRRVTVSTPEGRFWIDPGSYLGGDIATPRGYEPETLAVIKQVLGPGQTFVDVGANEGYFSVVASRLVGAAGRVVTVEPQARLQEVLRRNLQLNGCANVALATVAITDLPGTAEFHLTPDMNNSASGLTRATRYKVATQTVRCQTLAELFADQGVGQAVVKMDIEGWEYEAILGSPELFRSGRVRVLVLEIHGQLLAARGLDPEKISHFLAECGYQPRADAFGTVWTLPA